MQTEIFLEDLPPNPNVTKGKHWASLYAENQYWKQYAHYTAKQTKGTLLEKAHIHYHISVGDNRRHDADNLIASLKPVQDGLVGVLITDDNIDCITVAYSFDREKPRGVHITVKPPD